MSLKDEILKYAIKYPFVAPTWIAQQFNIPWKDAKKTLQKLSQEGKLVALKNGTYREPS